MKDPKIAYNNLPNIFPKDFDFKDPDILIKSIPVMSLLAKLDAITLSSKFNLSHTFNMLEPLYVPEAVASSSIEEIVTTNESVYIQRALKDDKATGVEKEVMRYMDALVLGFHLIDKKGFLATNQYIDIQKELEPKKTGIRRLPGTSLSNPQTGETYYTPPDNEKIIRSLLKNFEGVYNEKSPKHEILIRAAILHYQFEAIHPFPDGNGRTGRILIPLYLKLQDILYSPILFISKYILENREQYYKKLRNVTFKGEWKEWVLYMLDAFETQTKYTLDVLEKLAEFDADLEDSIEKCCGSNKVLEIAGLFYEYPYFTQKQFEKEVGVSPATARKYMLSLIINKVVTRSKQEKRNRYLYVCPEYIKIMKSI